MLESRHVGINRRVTGSSPVSGAIFSEVMFWVYILENPQGRFYVGCTDDLPLRLESLNPTDKILSLHNAHPISWELVWSEEHPSRSSAISRERQIKSMKSARWIREQLLNVRVPTRRD